MYVPADYFLVGETNPTFGSGTADGIRGGGRIILSSTSTINITRSAMLRADGGSNFEIPTSGAGSGGSIVLTATEVVGSGTLSVQGGNTFGSGGAGGGGRITVEVGTVLIAKTIITVHTVYMIFILYKIIHHF